MKLISWRMPTATEPVVHSVWITWPVELSILRAALDAYYMQQLADTTDNVATRARLLKTGEMLKQLPTQ